MPNLCLTSVILLLGAWTTCSTAEVMSLADTGCFPPPDTSVPQFMVGYGSLMQNKSKYITAPGTGPSIPVRITGFRRGWNMPSIGLSYHTTFLGIVPDKNAAVNGIIFQLPTDGYKNMDLATLFSLYDAREDLYCRRPVPVSAIKLLARNYDLDPHAQYWIYANAHAYESSYEEQRSSAEYPIVLSYVDVFISGCLELEAQYNLSALDFAASCVRDTSGWDSCWVNDRIFPRRPFIHQPRVREIDTLLETHAEEAFKNLKLEGQCETSSSSSSALRTVQTCTLWTTLSINGLLLLVFVYRTQTL